MSQSNLPFGSEFSPSQIELAWLLETAKVSAGDWRTFEKSVYEQYFKNYSTTEINKRKLANNTKLGMAAYGIIASTQNTTLTEFGEELYNVYSDEQLLYETFAKHILLNLHGLDLIETVKDMQASGEAVTLNMLRQWLEQRGIHFPRGGKHPSMIRLWLEKAGVFSDEWQVNQKGIDKILGVSEEDIQALRGLTLEQRTFLRALANIGEEVRYSNDIEKYASSLYGISFDEKNLPKKVLYPLEKAGFIRLTRETTGRGAKPFSVEPTEKFSREVFAPLLEKADQWIDNDLRTLLRKPFVAILEGLKSKNTYEKGLALEALAFKLMRLLDMTYVKTRLRGSVSGGAEVDLVFESNRLVFSRWLVCCSDDSKGVRLDDIATKVGLNYLYEANGILIISVHNIQPQARQYANSVSPANHPTIVMLDGEALKSVYRNPETIRELFDFKVYQNELLLSA
jgi:hypothetical protein